MKTTFADRGLMFTPFADDKDTFISEYNGEKFEAWRVTRVDRPDLSLGVFRFKVGTYKTRAKLSASFNPEREKYSI